MITFSEEFTARDVARIHQKIGEGLQRR